MFKNETQKLIYENNVRADEEKLQAWNKYRDAMNTEGSSTRLESINKTYSDEIIAIDKRHEDTKKAIYAKNAEEEQQLANKQQSCEELNQPNVDGALTTGFLKGVVKEALDPRPAPASSSMFDRPIEEAAISVAKEFSKAVQAQEECERQKAVERVMDQTVDPLITEALNNAFDPLGVFSSAKKSNVFAGIPISPKPIVESTMTFKSSESPVLELLEMFNDTKKQAPPLHAAESAPTSNATEIEREKMARPSYHE